MGKYLNPIALHNDAAKNSLWRASSLASGSSTPSNSYTDRQPKPSTKQWSKSSRNDSKQWSKATKWSSMGGASGGASSSADPKKTFDPKKRKVAFEKDKSFES
jgi:hypothetical protein